MEIKEVKRNKNQYLSLFLLADEQENMMDRYLENGTMYVLDDKGIKAECVVTDEGNGILERHGVSEKEAGVTNIKLLPYWRRIIVSHAG